MSRHPTPLLALVLLAACPAGAQQWVAPIEPSRDPWVRPAQAQQPPPFSAVPPLAEPSLWGNDRVPAPRLAQAGSPLLTFDPYQNPSAPSSVFQPAPAYQSAPLLAAPVAAGVRRPAHFEGVGLVGDAPESVGTNLFVPLRGNQDSFVFADIRGEWDDEQAAEGNFGLAYRRFFDDWIAGVYGFYDFNHTQFNNNFHGATVGVEAFNLEWEGRFNWYIPEGGTQGVSGLNVASLDASGDIVVQQGFEQALYGFDGEIGRLLLNLGTVYDAEVRGFIGGYFFEAGGPLGESLGGPRARVEGRLFDLPLLGAGSRVTFEGRVQWDEVRDTQGIASVTIRIPFGGRASRGATLTPLERRMLEPIRRDEDFVTLTGLGAAEQAVLVGNGADGLALTNVTEINAATADVPAAVAAGTDIVVVTGDVNTTAPIVLNPGQFIGGAFAVRGQTSGAAATFGTRATINAAGADAIQVADNTTVAGLNIRGDQGGIVGGADGTRLPDDADVDPDGVIGLTVNDNTIDVTGNAIQLDGPVNGSITGNNLTGSGFGSNGLQIGTFASGSISGNTLINSNANGLLVTGDVSGGSISGNTARDNGSNGFEIAGTILGGQITGNLAESNDADGFQVNAFTAGTFSSNVSNANVGVTYNFPGLLPATAIIINNTGVDAAGVDQPLADNP